MTPRKARPAPKAEAAAAKATRTGWESGLPPGMFIFLAVTLFYVWTATSSQYAFVWGTKKGDHYNLLAEGFLKGHLYLAQDPPKELLALKDPFDPVANAPYRLHDASLYKGHYYVYFGPVPVLTLYLPWRVITGWSIPNNLATILYLLAGYIFSCLLLFALLRACGIVPGWLQKRLAIAALGLCQAAPIVLRRAFMYETAVAAGFCFAVAALYFLARYMLLPGSRPWHAVLAGLFLGFTPGCRPNYAVFVAVVGAGYLIHLLRIRKQDNRDLWRDLYLFGGPVAACGLLLAWYNYARFGNPLNIGQVYQLVGTLEDRGLTSKVSNLLPGLYRLLLQTPVWVRHFPFFEIPNPGDFGAEVWPRGTDYVENIAGILPISPICLAGVGLPLLLWRFRKLISAPARVFLLTIYAAIFINMVAIVMTVNRVCQRYEMDFAPELVVLSLFAMMFLAARLDSTVHRRAAAAVLGAGVIAGILIQMALSINSYDNQLAERDIGTFDRIARFLGDNDNNLRRLVYWMGLNGTIAFQPQPAGKREALVTTGVPGRSDCVYVEYLDGGRLRFAAYMTGRGAKYGPPIPVTPGRPYLLSVDYNAGKNLITVKLDDALALEAQKMMVYPTSFADATVLVNHTGMPPQVEPFSGALNAPQGLQFASTAN
jgi:hypothetical protein